MLRTTVLTDMLYSRMLYKYILESNYGAKVSSMNLLVLHPDYKDFVHLTVPEMQKEAKYLIEQAIELSR